MQNVTEHRDDAVIGQLVTDVDEKLEATEPEAWGDELDLAEGERFIGRFLVGDEPRNPSGSLVLLLAAEDGQPPSAADQPLKLPHAHDAALRAGTECGPNRGDYIVIARGRGPRWAARTRTRCTRVACAPVPGAAGGSRVSRRRCGRGWHPVRTGAPDGQARSRGDDHRPDSLLEENGRIAAAARVGSRPGRRESETTKPKQAHGQGERRLETGRSPSRRGLRRELFQAAVPHPESCGRRQRVCGSCSSRSTATTRCLSGLGIDAPGDGDRPVAARAAIATTARTSVAPAEAPDRRGRHRSSRRTGTRAAAGPARVAASSTSTSERGHRSAAG